MPCSFAARVVGLGSSAALALAVEAGTPARGGATIPRALLLISGGCSNATGFMNSLNQSTAFQFSIVTVRFFVFTSIHKSNLPGLLVGEEET